MTDEATLVDLSVVEQVRLIIDRRVSATALVSAYLGRVDRYNEAIGAFVHVDHDGALKEASGIDDRLNRGEAVGPLAGIPYGVKDFSNVRGMPTYAGSHALSDGQAEPVDDPMVARLRAAGAIAIGKTNVPEFGMHSATYNERFGVTRNPWNLECTPGGSSGGSSAAVAAGLVSFATGSDGGGSIRTPAAFCGLIGMKSTSALVPRASGESQLSCLGFLTRTVADTARLLDTAGGAHSCDRLSVSLPAERLERLMQSLNVSGLKIAWSPDFGYAPMEAEAVSIAREAFEQLVESAALERKEISIDLPNVYKDWIVGSLNFLAEELALDGVDITKLDQRTQALLASFSKSDPNEHIRIQKSYCELERRASALFSEIDLIATPSTACAAFGAEEEPPQMIGGRDAVWTGAEPLSMFANVLGVPAISIPAGLTKDGLPIGLQIAARRFDDGLLLRLARMVEETRPWPLLALDFA